MILRACYAIRQIQHRMPPIRGHVYYLPWSLHALHAANKSKHNLKQRHTFMHACMHAGIVQPASRSRWSGGSCGEGNERGS